jgi:hypothetical protein
MHNLYTSLVPSHWLQKPHETFKKLKKCIEFPVRSWLYSQKMWMWSLARMEQFSFQIKSQTSQQTWNRHRALKLCAIYPQSCMVFLTIVGTTTLMASSFRHTVQIQSIHHQNLAQNSFRYCPNFVCHIFISFLRTQILELTATKHLWAYLHLNIRNNFSFINVLVQLLYSLRYGFLTFSCAMDRFESLVKTNNLFS